MEALCKSCLSPFLVLRILCSVLSVAPTSGVLQSTALAHAICVWPPNPVLRSTSSAPTKAALLAGQNQKP